MLPTASPSRVLFTVFASLALLIVLRGDLAMAQVTPDCGSGHCRPPNMDLCAPSPFEGSVTAPAFWFGSDADDCQGWPSLHHYICASPHEDLVVVWHAAAIQHGTGRALHAGKCARQMETVHAFTSSNSIIRYTQRAERQSVPVFIARGPRSQQVSAPVHSGLVTSVRHDFAVQNIAVHIATVHANDALDIVVTASPDNLIIGLGSLGSTADSRPNDGIFVAQLAEFVADRSNLPEGLASNNAVFVERADSETAMAGDRVWPRILGDQPTNSWSRSLSVQLSALSTESNVAPLFVLDTDRRLITWSRYTIWLPTD